MTSAWIVGAGMLPCGKHSDTPLHELGAHAARLALDDAGLLYEEIGEVFTSSMLAPPQSALRVAHSLGRTGIPVTAMESASAGGLVALRHAAWAVWSGRCEAALAIGYEKSTTLEPGGVVPKPRELWDLFPPQLSYAIDATRFLHDHGQSPELFAAVAAKSWNCAARNEFAARRPDHEVTIEEVLGSAHGCDPTHPHDVPRIGRRGSCGRRVQGPHARRSRTPRSGADEPHRRCRVAAHRTDDRSAVTDGDHGATSVRTYRGRTG